MSLVCVSEARELTDCSVVLPVMEKHEVIIMSVYGRVYVSLYHMYGSEIFMSVYCCV